MSVFDEFEVVDPSPATGAGEQTYSVVSTATTVTTTIVSQTASTSDPNADMASTTNAAASSESSGSSSGGSSQSNGTDRTTVIILSTVLSVFGVLVIVGGLWACLRCRRRRSKLFSRGITPIPDEEIETWKGHRNEKSVEANIPVDEPQPVMNPPTTRPDSRGHHRNQDSTSSVRKPPSVIVYARQSEELSPRSPPTPNFFPKMSFDGKTSIDKDLPFTPIQARAPNAREGLTDETIPGDEPYLPGPRRRASRLSKAPRTPRLAHTRNKSSRSSLSLRSPGEGFFGGDYDSDHEIYPTHSRISSDIPPRLSLSNDWPAGGGLSPRPLVRAEDIGRAIG